VQTTYLNIASGYGGGEGLSTSYLAGLGLPIVGIQEVCDPIGRRVFEGKFDHSSSDYWHRCLDLYRSANTGTSLVVPVWGFVDTFLIHFMILYALSIVVRYLPSLWFDIEFGPLDHVRTLIEQYVATVDDVLPKMAVERIESMSLEISMPGSLSSPR
jgi:hypothetical protein